MSWVLDMDMDDDFIGEIEFNLDPAQGELVNQAIELAAALQGDDFAAINPLITIMQWWETNVPEKQNMHTTADETLVEACKSFIAAHKDQDPDSRAR
ncbi:MAG: hypothetical protein ACR2OX_05180 [Methyloligellaceae bacterium]